MPIIGNKRQQPGLNSSISDIRYNKQSYAIQTLGIRNLKSNVYSKSTIRNPSL